MQLYIFDSSVKIGFSENRIVVKSAEDGEKSYPIETVDGVSLFGVPHISTVFIREMLLRGIELYFYSTDGHYFGRMNNPSLVSTEKQRKQALLGTNEPFRLALSKRFVRAKIQNQISLLRAHDESGILGADYFDTMSLSYARAETAASIGVLMGYEGTAARAYFAALSRLLPEDFRFYGRSTRPPKDAFNSLISLGYSLLYKNIIGAVEKHGLNPYFGFMHADSEGHMALVSDLMEEWRAMIVDDTAVQLVKSDALRIEMFTPNEEGGIFMSREGAKILIKATAEKVGRAKRYLSYDECRYGFQHALDLQLHRLWRAIDNEDPTYYIPVTEWTDDELADGDEEVF
jgi:CRISPR-associated protein Cas1